MLSLLLGCCCALLRRFLGPTHHEGVLRLQHLLLEFIFAFLHLFIDVVRCLSDLGAARLKSFGDSFPFFELLTGELLLLLHLFVVLELLSLKLAQLAFRVKCAHFRLESIFPVRFSSKLYRFACRMNCSFLLLLLVVLVNRTSDSARNLFLSFLQLLHSFGMQNLALLKSKFLKVEVLINLRPLGVEHRHLLRFEWLWRSFTLDWSLLLRFTGQETEGFEHLRLRTLYRLFFVFQTALKSSLLKGVEPGLQHFGRDGSHFRSHLVLHLLLHFFLHYHLLNSSFPDRLRFGQLPHLKT